MSGRKSLRVLYTINSSPQYILARSLSPISVSLISQPENFRSTPALYASVSLKTCLDAICRSSPDLIQDSTRDFSLYVLDPLESNSAPAPVNISNAHGDTAGSTSSAVTEKPRPVAVGLGLMSWALASSDCDPVCVTGTLMTQPNGQEALEVIFALRETLAVKRRPWEETLSSSQESVSTGTSKQADLKQTSQGQSLNSQPSSTFSRSTSTSDLTRETVTSIQMRSKAKAKAPKQARYSNTPITESDKLMYAADTYIGPLKKKGRPKSINTEPRSSKSQRHRLASSQIPAQKEVIVLDASDNENNSVSVLDGDAKKKWPSQQPRPLTRHHSRQTGLQPKNEGINGISFPLSSLPTSLSSVDSTAPNTALLTALATIDSTNNQFTHENPQNEALVAALKQLLAIYTKPNSSSKPTTPFLITTTEATSRPSQLSSSSQSDGIVFLDKENVNPTTSRMYTGKTGFDKFSDPLPFASNPSKERGIQSLRPSSRPNEICSSNTPKETVSQSVPAVRKRTLSDFMDEKESGRRNKGKGRESAKKHRDSSLRRSEMSVADTMRHYPQVLAATLPRMGQPSNYYRTPSDPSTSPARGRADDAENNFPNEKHLSPRNYQRVSASSPIRPKEGRKKYVVPDWARTDTATRPRLSEEAKRAMEEAEAKKREERNAARRKLVAKQGQTKSSERVNAPKAEPFKPAEQSPRPQFVIAKPSDLSQGPISATHSGPVIAFSLVSSSRASSPPPLPTSTPRTPKTPSKKRMPYANGDGDGSLFTPITQSGSLFGSAVSHRSIHGTPPSFLTSPLENRKKAKVSSTQSIFTGHGITALHAWSSGSSPLNPVVSDEREEDSDLGKEPEEALDGLDCPPGSLPIASSDIDVDCHSQCTGEADDDSGEQTVKQHWAGLPPSSPPPPSSPMLVPESRTDDEDMDELPIATSDSEVDADMNAFDTTGGTSPNTPEAEASQTAMNLTVEDLTALFSTESRPSSVFQLSSSTTLDLFEQYTNVNAQSDDISAVCGSSSTDGDLQTMFQNGIGNLDFTEFWETLKPMVNTEPPHPQDNVEQSFAEFFGIENTQHGDIAVDHSKLADDIQSLFSGYLV